ncbi:molybdopterin synthase sulfur carrier subunit [Sphingomonas vulcanisoli]|uniref:Molybdopterin synthase sulfur carrier subunit n=1 Tax=Sphingomonas vulcanisoli TaxID=1658060 RepID=A0ABX0TVW9_9SPHN|nr:molybdopterin converting factor subunit 1 [Sphingomonas vulcanisoli]NIJ08849.1 molybdopterin synthase sulfur carrier subunit [Sphingomonas vulcanisoli]
MALDILYFAWVRETIGRDQEQVDPPASVETVADLIEWLSQRSPAHAEALADRQRLRAAVDHTFADPAAPIAGAREIALFPPVTGG